MKAQQRWSDVAFGLAFAAAFVLFLIIVLPFFIPMLFAILLVVLVSPVFNVLTRLLKGKRRLASLLTSLGVVLAVVIPSFIVAFELVSQAVALFSRVSLILGEGQPLTAPGVLGSFLARILEPLERIGVLGALKDVASESASMLSAKLAPAVAAVGNLIIGVFLLIIGMYYFFLDGPALMKEIVEISPIEESYSWEIAKDLGSVLRSLFLSSFLTAIVQGLLGVAAFFLVGLPHAIVWAALMAFFSLIFALVPILGTGIVWVPASIWLISTGRLEAGLFLFAWGLLVLGSVDYFIRPLVTRLTTSLHPLLVLLTVFGGIAAFGPVGAVVGPMVGALAATFSRVWVRDVRPDIQ